MWVSLWENVWQASVEPTRGAIYDTDSIALALRHAFNSSGALASHALMLTLAHHPFLPPLRKSSGGLDCLAVTVM
jgi:hypothetical protein